MQKCVRDYVRGNMYHIKVPDQVYIEMSKRDEEFDSHSHAKNQDPIYEEMIRKSLKKGEKLEEKKMKNHVSLFLDYDEKEDADVIEFLGRVRKGYLNSFCKQVCRKYILGGTLLAYFNTISDREFVKSMQYDDNAPIIDWDVKEEKKSKQRKVNKILEEENEVEEDAVQTQEIPAPKYDTPIPATIEESPKIKEEETLVPKTTASLFSSSVIEETEAEDDEDDDGIWSMVKNLSNI